ncbi:hypothetical protein N356_gp107 [Cellulophaga phage phi14:2]|uniref:Uncharacterized protein n=1 Tax=Cellulophaga phage phi14:2 TaxID=1327990 RepID=S0A0W1_9CAUD|nr:hypothetical protein N356_gp107 [Cellulophaga phage phi14:2]AGO49001.1 hypothetical protein Phi14:2_gp123 [Cellulophaga phage phi14:2]
MEKLRNQRNIYVDVPKNNLGGQGCNIITYPTIVEHKDLGIKISIDCYKSNFKNKELAIILFDMAFDEIIKNAK